MLAYIIKGFFLTLKKSYEAFTKDLETFIDINIKGLKRKKLKRDKDDQQDMEKMFTMQNLSLFSENSQFEKLLTDNNLTKKISNTLKKISKI